MRITRDDGIQVHTCTMYLLLQTWKTAPFPWMVLELQQNLNLLQGSHPPLHCNGNTYVNSSPWIPFANDISISSQWTHQCSLQANAHIHSTLYRNLRFLQKVVHFEEFLTRMPFYRMMHFLQEIALSGESTPQVHDMLSIGISQIRRAITQHWASGTYECACEHTHCSAANSSSSERHWL